MADPLKLHPDMPFITFPAEDLRKALHDAVDEQLALRAEVAALPWWRPWRKALLRAEARGADAKQAMILAGLHLSVEWDKEEHCDG